MPPACGEQVHKSMWTGQDRKEQGAEISEADPERSCGRSVTGQSAPTEPEAHGATETD